MNYLRCSFVLKFYSIITIIKFENTVKFEASGRSIESDEFKDLLQDSVKVELIRLENEVRGEQIMLIQLKWGRCSEWVCVWFNANYVFFVAVVWPVTRLRFVPGWTNIFSPVWGLINVKA